MSALLENFSIIHAIWMITLVFFLTSILTCVMIIFRRIRRNRIGNERDRQKIAFQTALLGSLKLSDDEKLDLPECDIREISSTLLHLFRTLKGQHFEILQDRVCATDLETRLIDATKIGIRGTRMRALKVLSYLNSDTSLIAAFDRLNSSDKYVRLTAARALAKRRAHIFLKDIISSLVEAFPDNPDITAYILVDFGHDACSFLEDHIETNENSIERIACLKALYELRPSKIGIDLSDLVRSKDPALAISAISLASVTNQTNIIAPMLEGLSRDETKLKIGTSKIASKLRRKKLVPALYELTDDPELWVRYWALKAIWNTGASGRQFIDALAHKNPTAADLSLEMRSGYV